MFRFLRKYQFFPSASWQDFLILFGGLSLYVGLAVSTIDKFSIWFDEAFGSYLIRFDYLSVARYTSTDVHPPMYYWLLKFWTTYFGNTEFGIRSMSVFFGAVTVFFTFLVVLRLFGRRTAYVSLLFLILSPMFIRYSQEARMYTLLTADIMAATYMLIYALHSKKRWPWIIYGVMVGFGVLTQYLCALAWVAHWVWRFLMVRTHGEPVKASVKKIFSRQWVLAYAVAVLVFLPWVPFFLIQFLTVQGQGFWIKPFTVATLPDFVSTILLFLPSSEVKSWAAAGVCLLVVAFVYSTFRLLHQLQGDDHKNYLLILCLIVVPTLLLCAMSMPPLRPAFVDRYLLEVIVFLAVLFGINLTLSRTFLSRNFRVLTGVILAVVLMFGIYSQTVVGNYNRASGQSNNVRQLLEKVRADSQLGTPILSSTPWIFYEAAIYDRPDSPIYFVNETTMYKFGSLTMLYENDMHKIKDLDAFTRQHKSFWVIANLLDTEPNALRSNWNAGDVMVINDDLTGNPLYKAIKFTVE